ncbi:MAG: hypothetical protein V4844_06190 [Pseudomonadota bacterium]
MRKLLPLLRLPVLLLRGAAPVPRGPKPPELMTDSDWVRHRAPRRHRDETLSNAAVAWLARLPADFRPDALAARYPRIANRLALLWRDPGLIEQYLDELLVPKRPDRQGFPSEVAADLQSLQMLNEHRLYGPDEDQGDRAA